MFSCSLECYAYENFVDSKYDTFLHKYLFRLKRVMFK